MTILCHAVMVLPAPERTAVAVEDALVLHSPAYHVKGVTMMPVMLNQDTVQFGWDGVKDALDMGT